MALTPEKKALSKQLIDAVNLNQYDAVLGAIEHIRKDTTTKEEIAEIINASKAGGHTALHIAAENGDKAVIKILINNGANVEKKARLVVLLYILQLKMGIKMQ